jgi:hypothetical protein
VVTITLERLQPKKMLATKQSTQVSKKLATKLDAKYDFDLAK